VGISIKYYFQILSCRCTWLTLYKKHFKFSVQIFLFNLAVSSYGKTSQRREVIVCQIILSITAQIGLHGTVWIDGHGTESPYFYMCGLSVEEKFLQGYLQTRDQCNQFSGMLQFIDATCLQFDQVNFWTVEICKQYILVCNLNFDFILPKETLALLISPI
jgi:hypothetical protein